MRPPEPAVGTTRPAADLAQVQLADVASVDSVAEWRHPYKYRVIKNTSALKEEIVGTAKWGGVKASASRGRLLRERSADTPRIAA